MKKIKVVHILKAAGGVEIAVRLIIDHINPDLIENYIIHDHKEKKYLDRNLNELSTFFVPYEREVKFLKDLKSLFATYKLIKKIQPDLIHCHSAKPGIMGRITGYLLGVPTLYTPHAFSYFSAESKYKRKFFILIEKLTRFKNTFVLACSPSEQQRAIDDIGYPISNALCWANSMPKINESDLKPITNSNLKKPFICMLGRITYQKNMDLLIDTIKVVKNSNQSIKLYILGAGFHSPDHDRINKLIKEYDLIDNVEIIPWVERFEALNYVKEAKFIVSSARYEGLPLFLLEAISLGKACVVTNVDGNKDVIQDGVNGFLVNENSIDFAEAIQKLYNNQDLLHLFESNANKIFEKDFSIKENILKLESIYTAFVKI